MGAVEDLTSDILPAHRMEYSLGAEAWAAPVLPRALRVAHYLETERVGAFLSCPKLVVSSETRLG